jgi:predicted DNA-binding ribbon-helix-helix protein
MRSRAPATPDSVDRVQTGVRMEKRLVKVLKAVAELRDLALGELLEELVHDAFAGRHYFEESALPSIRELMRIYGMDHDSMPAARAEERG